MKIELGTPMSLKEIALATGGETLCDKNPLITRLCTDTREVATGELFFSLKGIRFNGDDYVESARKKGAFILSSRADTTDIFHPETRRALLDFAAHYAKTLPYLLYRIGITGSVGKTTTKEFLKIMLSQKFITHASLGNFNNEIGLPLSILSAKRDTQILLMEMGMSNRGEIKQLSKCLCPDLAVITNVGSAHIGRLGSREEIAKAKIEILDGMDGGKIIIPEDECLLSHLENKITFSTTDKDANLYIEKGENGLINVYVKGEKISSSSFALHEEHHVKCLAAAVGVCIKAGLSDDEISRGISLISRVNTRQTEFCTEKYHFFIDCYNASLESMLAAIKEFSIKDTKGSKSLLLGDILELGEFREYIHFEVGKSISSKRINTLFLYGNHAEEIGMGAIKSGFPQDRIHINSNANEPSITYKQICENCKDGEHILVKGSRGIKLERVVDCFKTERRTKNE